MTYHGQRAPNVSEFIANLNAIPSAQDVAQSQDNLNFEEDLAMFTNTQFFDFDLGQNADVEPTSDFRFEPFEGLQHTAAPQPSADAKLDFDLQGEFNFPGFDFQQPTAYPANGASVTTMQPATKSVYPPFVSAASPTDAAPQSGDKRKADAITDSTFVSTSDDFEDASRLAAEEDKRRRNTAASARFRVKKKQREQALEKSAKEMSDKMAALQSRISQLETENKWLKNLVIEKSGDETDVADFYKKYAEAVPERKGDGRNDGVGTNA